MLVSAGSGADASSSAAALTAVRPTVALESRFVATVKAVAPSVVEIKTGARLGSGVVLDRRGNIVTNRHVTGSSKRFRVTISTGQQYDATLVGTYAPNDLAVIRVSGANLKPLPLADSSRLRVGDLVLAVGNPLGLRSSVTQGIVSGLGRTVTVQSGGLLPDVIQTSAAINPGNSGGALVDLSGRLVGMPTLTALQPEGSRLANGIGFAIPSNTVKAIASQIVRYGRVVRTGRASLGIRLATTLSGRVFVTDADPRGPAASAGIVAGDTITAIDGRIVRSIDDVAAILGGRGDAGSMTIRIRRASGKTASLVVVAGRFVGD